MALWPLAVAVWLAPALALFPAALVVLGGVGPGLAQLPASGELPPGEVMLVLADGLGETSGSVIPAVGSALAALWFWTVLWHAGVVTRTAARGRTGPEPLLAVLGSGVRRIGRFLRLAATALLAGAAGLAAVAAVAVAVVRRAWLGGAEAGAIAALAGGGAVALAWVLLCWAGVLHGAWLLVDPRRRSGVLAWVGGVGASLQRPLATALTLGAWALPSATLLLAPLAAGWWMDPLRGAVGSALVGAVAGLLRGFCWVALFASFAPPPAPPPPVRARGRRVPRSWFHAPHHPLPPGP